MVEIKLTRLKHIKIIEHGGKQYISFEDFIKYLIENRKEGDIKIRTDKVQEEVLRHNIHNIFTIDGKKFLSFEAVILYTANHAKNIQICDSLLKDMASCLLGKQNEFPSDSVKTLYKEIVKLLSDDAGFYPGFHLLLSDVDFHHTPPETLYLNYKDDFSPEQWNFICIFEQNFSLYSKTNQSYDEQLASKWEFLNRLKETISLGNSLNKKCHNLISMYHKRHITSEYLYEKPHLQAKSENGVVHLFEKLEEDARLEIEKTFHTECQVVSVDCCPSICCHDNAVHVFVHIACENVLSHVNDIATIVRSVFETKHGLYTPEVIFINSSFSDVYKCSQCKGEFDVHRFHLRDDFYTKKLSENVLYISKSKDEDILQLPPSTIQSDGKSLCHSCFEAVEPYITKPLSWQNFDIIQEWLKEVPLEIQCLLSSMFINRITLKRSDEPKDIFREKVVRLYGCLEACLGILNFKFTGVLQQMNTEELMVGYHAVSTVFNVTSQCGISQSLRSADRWLQKAADIELSHYETYLKKHPLFYEKKGDWDFGSHSVAMQECFIILFLDNLVRLTVHQDPSPGQSKTSQICTLPITLKGLPKDSDIIRYWHTQECNDPNNCQCMEENELTENDFELLTHLTTHENKALTKLTTQTLWGVCTLIQKDNIAEFKQLQHSKTNTFQDIEEELDLFNSTLQSLVEEHELEQDDVNVSTIGDKDVYEIQTNVLKTQKNIEHFRDIDDIEESNYIYLESSLTEDAFILGLQGQSMQSDDGNINIDLSISSDQIENDTSNTDRNKNEENTSYIYSHASTIDHIDTHLFTEYHVSPMLCRHPVPATGRDDDKANLRKILLDILTKLGRYPTVFSKERILFAPDYKISKNVIELVKEGGIYRQFLPEFPLLHLRKSKIVNLFSAYKDAGLFHLFKYMKDDEQEKEWMKLISIQHIETATNNIKRMSMGIHLAFLIKFLDYLPEQEATLFETDVESGDITILNSNWRQKFNHFLETGRQTNATFALHLDIMQHTDEIIGISLSERIGGPEGYNLLLGCVKTSLPFSFLNGATSYASFCVDLLYLHYSCGIFHQNLKNALYTTPHRGSVTKFALDTQREIDHRDAIKSFRPHSTVGTVVPRMAIVDRLSAVQDVRSALFGTKDTNDTNLTDNSKSLTLQYDLTPKDMKFVLPVAKVILQENGLSIEKDNIPRNIYHTDKIALSPSILDTESYDLGKYLIHKYACQQELFGFSKTDIPNLSSVEGSSTLKSRAKKAKGTTIRRSTIKLKDHKTEKDKNEEKRQAQNKKIGRVTDCMSSNMNACQALLNPDLSKPLVSKSLGIKKAIFKALSFLNSDKMSSGLSDVLLENDLIYSNLTKIPTHISQSVTFASIEFAGVKFKSKALSGKEYLSHIQSNVINSSLHSSKFPNIKHLVICEEKYSFTPDDFKAATRLKRQKTSEYSIIHLKHGQDILSEDKLSKSAVISTNEGKRLISNFLARYINQLTIKHDIIIDVDSELVFSDDKSYCTPIRSIFSKETGFSKQILLPSIKQSKGEAEMSQVDWLVNLKDELQENEAALSVVSSADIDSIYIHLFAMSLYWPRKDDNTFKNPVYVLLQKQSPEIYNITGIIEKIEQEYGHFIGVSLAICLCLGGNDFLLKFNHITHEKWLTMLLIDEPILLQNLLKFEYGQNDPVLPVGAKIDTEIYLEVVKRLYCPTSLDASKLSFEEVRQLSIQPISTKARTKHPTQWMPPKSALLQVAKLINCQIAYLFSVGNPNSKLPDFLTLGPFKKDVDGISYDLGPDVKIDNVQEILKIPIDDLKSSVGVAKLSKRKRKLSIPSTPQSKKISRPLVSTPKASSKS